MNVAILNSNFVKINQYTKKGSEIFDYILITNLAKLARKNGLKLTAFASGNSRLPVKTESINYYSSLEDKNIGVEYHKIFEMSLISKAFSMQNKFDIYHANLGNGEMILPFARFVKKPIVVTMHGSIDECFSKKFFSQFKDLKNVFFVSISNSQRRSMPDLNYIRTIYHGIDIDNSFKFNEKGDGYILWTGRAIPDKGLDIVLSVIKKTRKKAKIFPIIKEEYLIWLHREILKKRNLINQVVKIGIDFDVNRKELVTHYQNSKLFLFPVQTEEPFGFVLIESLACGTPVVAFARGSVPEVIKDGETGFIVNPSDTEIRGNWIIKKTGLDGLCEAVERIYSMPLAEYQKMRVACRQHAEKNFSVERMVNEYIDVYKEILSGKLKK